MPSSHRLDLICPWFIEYASTLWLEVFTALGSYNPVCKASALPASLFYEGALNDERIGDNYRVFYSSRLSLHTAAAQNKGLEGK